MKRRPDRVPQLLRCHAVDNAPVLEITDNGLKQPEQLALLLLRLFQILPTHVEGSGVGLYMGQRIVENAGDTITVASELGVGTTFTVTFPA